MATTTDDRKYGQAPIGCRSRRTAAPLDLASLAAQLRQRGGRGEGLVYAGSVGEVRGGVVIGMTDCGCAAHCARLDIFSDARRLEVTLQLEDGSYAHLSHVRGSSFTGRD